MPNVPCNSSWENSFSALSVSPDLPALALPLEILVSYCAHSFTSFPSAWWWHNWQTGHGCSIHAPGGTVSAQTRLQSPHQHKIKEADWAWAQSASRAGTAPTITATHIPDHTVFLCWDLPKCLSVIQPARPRSTTGRSAPFQAGFVNQSSKINRCWKSPCKEDTSEKSLYKSLYKSLCVCVYISLCIYNFIFVRSTGVRLFYINILIFHLV